jgi:hypothetical protein
MELARQGSTFMLICVPPALDTERACDRLAVRKLQANRSAVPTGRRVPPPPPPPRGPPAPQRSA